MRTAPVAEFDIAGRPFSLVPGGPVQLGFDEQTWVPTEAEMASYRGDPRALEPFATPSAQSSPTPDWSTDELADIRAHLAKYTRGRGR